MGVCSMLRFAHPVSWVTERLTQLFNAKADIGVVHVGTGMLDTLEKKSH